MILSAPSSQAHSTLEYYRTLSDEELLARLKQAEEIWFTLLVQDVNPMFAPAHNTCLSFWEFSREHLELIAKERNLFSETTIS